MIKGTTSSGFEYEVSDKIGNDFRFVRTIAKIENGSDMETLTGMVDLAGILLGDGGIDRLSAHVQEPDGTVPIDRIMEELNEIISSAQQKDGTVKN